MLTRFTTTLMTILTVLFAVLFLYQQQKATALQRKLDEQQQVARIATQAITLTNSLLQLQVQTLQTTRDDATKRVAALTEAVQHLEAAASNAATTAAAAPAAAATAAPAKKEENSAKGFAQSLASMMKDPAMKDTLRTQMKMALEPMYGGLLQDLGLKGEDADAFRELLVERQMAAVNLGAQLMDGSLSEEEQKKVMAQIEKDQAQVDDMIKNMLGEENYARYKDYQKAEQERMLISQYRQQLSGSGVTLDRATENKLVAAMSAARDEERKSSSYFDAQKAQPSQFDGAAVTKYMQQEKNIADRTLDVARGFMTPDEFEQFRAFQENQLQMREAQMKMAQRMFEKPQPADKK
jgi:hypothetical protein